MPPSLVDLELQRSAIFQEMLRLPVPRSGCRGTIVSFRQACVVLDSRFNSWKLCRDGERVRASG